MMGERLLRERSATLMGILQELDAIEASDFDGLLSATTRGISRLLDASMCCIVLSDATGPRYVPAIVMGPMFDDRQLAAIDDWQDNDSWPSCPILALSVDPAGRPRVIRQGPSAGHPSWDASPTRRLLEAIDVGSRLAGIGPLAPGIEMHVLVDRPRDERRFTSEDAELLELGTNILLPAGRRLA